MRQTRLLTHSVLEIVDLGSQRRRRNSGRKTILLSIRHSMRTVPIVSLPSVVAYCFGAGMLRAPGDSKSPILARLAGGFGSAAADWLLQRVLANGVRIETV